MCLSCVHFYSYLVLEGNQQGCEECCCALTVWCEECCCALTVWCEECCCALTVFCEECCCALTLPFFFSPYTCILLVAQVGQLGAHDQLLIVDGFSLVGLSQERYD